MYLDYASLATVAMLSKEEAAARIGTSIGTIHRSNLPRYRQGRRVFFRADDVDALGSSLRRPVLIWPSQRAA